MTGILKVDQWKDSGDNTLMTSDGAGVLTANAGITIPSGATITNNGTASGFGKIGQVISTSLTSTFQTSSTSLADSGISATITPSSTSSKVFMILNCNAYKGTGDRGYYGFFRGSTNLGGTSYGQYQLQNVNNYQHAGGNFLDSPNTTSSTTYKVYIRSGDGNVFYLNVSAQASNDGAQGSFTLMEVLA
jgi:hypothetical protein